MHQAGAHSAREGREVIFSRFEPEAYAPEEDPPRPSDWFKERDDLRFCQNLEDTRAELKRAAQYEQAFWFLLQGMRLIASRHQLPAIQKRTAENYMRLLGKNWPDLAGGGEG